MKAALYCSASRLSRLVKVRLRTGRKVGLGNEVFGSKHRKNAAAASADAFPPSPATRREGQVNKPQCHIFIE
jgi:hypothetical protein